MKKLLALYCGLVVSMAVVAAQTPPSATSGASSTTSPQTITVTGCVTPDTMTTPSTGSPRFVLSSIEPQGTAATPSASAARSTVTGYTLKPASDVNLSAHLNHKVQITGTVETATASSATSTQPSASSTSSAMPALRVTSVKMVSATCP